MTSNEDQGFPYYRSPESIRNEAFSRRMRGLDENEVREYLDLLADQVQAADHERREFRGDNERLQSENQHLLGEYERLLAENKRLQAELQRMRSEMAEFDEVGDRVNDQVVELFSQAQLVAEEMVEDVSRDARQRLGQARLQERQILEEAMQTAERTRRDAEALIRWTVPAAGPGVAPSSVDGAFGREPGHSGADLPAADELEHVRSFARAAQAQMQSIMDSFASELNRLGDVPPAVDAGRPAPSRDGSSSRELSGWQIEAPRHSSQDPRHSA